MVSVLYVESSSPRPVYCVEFVDKELYFHITYLHSGIQWNPNFTNLQGKHKLVRKIREFEKSGVKLQYSTEEGKRLLVQIIGRFIKLRVPEIGIPLYVK